MTSASVSGILCDQDPASKGSSASLYEPPAQEDPASDYGTLCDQLGARSYRGRGALTSHSHSDRPRCQQSSDCRHPSYRLLGLCETNDWESCHLDLILKVEALESDCLQPEEAGELVPDVPEPRVSTGPAELVTLHQMLGQECAPVSLVTEVTRVVFQCLHSTSCAS